LKILIVVPTYFPAYEFGGPIFQIHYLSKNLIKQNFTVDVCTTNKGNEKNFKSNLKQIVNGVNVFYFRRLFSKFYISISMFFFLFRNIKNYQIVHIHSVFNFPTAISLILSSVYNKKIILSPRGILDKELIKNKNTLLKKLWLFCLKRYLKKVDTFHATSNLEKEKIKFYFKNCNIKLIPNGIDIVDLNKKIDQKLLKSKYSTYFDKKINLLYIGRIDRKKNIDQIIRSIHKSKISNLNLNIVGNGDKNYLKYLHNITNDLRLKNNINFINHIDGDIKIYFYQNSSHLILPSKSENFANVVVESIFYGKSVLISDKVGLKDFVRSNNFGIICNSKKTFENELIDLIKNKKIIENTNKKGKEKVINHFDWNSVIHEYIKMYKEEL